ncbi:BlaI/MecI/CopY family transcriptional regulator [Maledivibacter halophilus]|uniref:BlaI family transcriptional regulator, penicillinase repressor n=1 Tax=Maledivibacter halophilus TaxID=36842 RepID=A0A1T5IM20_9FIRM|nr:BlaI/MecI/CopY family transcriptional regulator [Maledivibacter halophilus]SKC40112.1 BlaI family transcriptional regulator, penicillinase repressor [Maledivibacter halophilus]
MSENIPKISDAEWQVMKVLWKKSPLTAAKIIDKLQLETKWNRKTIHTLIRRLVKKEVLGIKEENPYTYYPLYEEELCMKKETKTFLKKVYDGSLQLLMANFLKNEKLSKEEINKLKKLLDKSQHRSDEK